MVVSSEGLHLLSNVAVWRHDFETINDKNVAMWHRYYIDVINFYIMKENDCQLIISNNNKKEYSTSDGWDVFRFQISEEHRLKTTFNNAEEFLYHWLVELKRCKENSRLRPIFMNVKKFKWNNKSQTLDDFRAEASARYKQLTYTQKALYRAIAKEYFRKKKSG